jgi:predicted metal-dependent peptidase
MPADLDRRKLAAARLMATTRQPYLASAVFAAVLIAAPDSGTIAIDRQWRIHADPAWVDRLNADELGRLLLHHLGHALRDHADRADRVGVERGAGGGAAQWNRATDAEINDDLAVDDLVPSVAPELPSSIGCLPGRLAEEYFTTANPGRRHWDCGSGCDGIPRPWDGPQGPGQCGQPGLDAQQAELLRLSTAAAVQQHGGTFPGTVPGGWLRWAERVLPSRTDWRRALAAEVRHGVATVAGNVDYTYRRPSRRATTMTDVIMPALRRPLPNVAIVCDTSGSMHEQLLGRALAEVEGILTRAGLRQSCVRVLAVDTNVHAVRRVSRAAQVELAGGGGTDMGRGIEAAAALRPRPAVVVVLTDGFTPWPSAPPKGVRVVIGLLREGPATGPMGPMGPMHGMAGAFAPPPWARTIEIEDPAYVRR